VKFFRQITERKQNFVTMKKGRNVSTHRFHGIIRLVEQSKLATEHQKSFTFAEKNESIQRQMKTRVFRFFATKRTKIDEKRQK
jgi:hypothetical protein